MQDHNGEESSQPQDQPQGTPAEGLDGEDRAETRRRRGVRPWVLTALAAAVVVATVSVVVTAGSSGGPRIGPASSTPARDVDTLLAGIPQAGDALGSPTAPVTLEFYGDLECPTSRAFTLVDLPSVISKWVRGGRLRIEYLSLETATREPRVFIDQQAAALAAGMQDRGWNYIELFYHEQGAEDTGYVTSSYLDGLAKQVSGLNLARWSRDRAEPPLAASVATDEQTAARLGLRSTPALLVARTGSRDATQVPRFYLKAPTALYTAIEDALARTSGSRASLTSYSPTAGRLVDADWRGGSTTGLGTQEAPC